MKPKNNSALVFVCSGAADVGELTDRAARQIRQEGPAAMSCLASIGGRIPDMMFNTAIADKVLVIDGCPQACASKTFQHAGITRFLHFNLGEIGLRKGASPLTVERIQAVVRKAAELLVS
jgi:uncharacterized metal-binding protein